MPERKEMKAVIQRVQHAGVSIGGELHASIGKGLLILVGIQADDTDEDIEWLTSKIGNLRVFNDENGVMNLSVKEINGEILAVSQFTLMARTKKGNRPEISVPLYERFVRVMNEEMQKEIKTGVFGANMQVDLTNDGPVTILMDTKNRI